MPENFPTFQSLRFWGTVALCSFFACAVMGARWEERLYSAGPGVLLRAVSWQSLQIHAAKRGAKPQASQKIKNVDGTITADYRFTNFNNDPLALSFSVPAQELASYRLEYGFTTAERAALNLWQKTAIEDACTLAVKNHHSQEQLDRAAEKIAAEYRTKLAHLYSSRAFTFVEKNVVSADIPEIVRRNVRKVKSLALSLNSSGEVLGYDSDSIIAAAVSFIQTAVMYETIPMELHGRQIGGVYPPIEALALGKGDCDTKSALVAAILLNWDKIKVVGVGVPGHYLIGILRNPGKGDAFVEYNGVRYVLVEPSGPGWLLPGTVDEITLSQLNASDKVKIDPFTK